MSRVGSRQYLHDSAKLLTKADEVGDSNSSDSAGDFTWTVEEETAVRRKLDKIIVPLTTFLYLLCFLDRYDDTFSETDAHG